MFSIQDLIPNNSSGVVILKLGNFKSGQRILNLHIMMKKIQKVSDASLVIMWSCNSQQD